MRRGDQVCSHAWSAHDEHVVLPPVGTHRPHLFSFDLASLGNQLTVAFEGPQAEEASLSGHLGVVDVITQASTPLSHEEWGASAQ